MMLGSQAEYARHRKVSRKTVTAWKHEGLLVLVEGRVDFGASDASLVAAGRGGVTAQAEMEPVTSAGNGPGAGISLVEAERRKETALAKLRELEFEVKSGQLVDIGKVQAALFDLWRTERDAWVNWPARIAPIIAAELGCDAGLLLIALEKHVREHLAERSGQPDLRVA